MESVVMEEVEKFREWVMNKLEKDKNKIGDPIKKPKQETQNEK